MDALLAWQSLVFYIPIAFGALLAVGAVLGLDRVGAGDHGAGGGGAHGGGDSDATLWLPALGKLPLTLRLMLLTFSFGGVGLVLGPVVRSLLPGGPALGGVLAIGIAAAGGLLVSAGAARLIARHLPLLETETVRRAELVGTTGRLVVRASEQVGVAHVRDVRGDLHQVACRLQLGERSLPAGTEVLLVEYDEHTNVFLAVRNPLAGAAMADGPPA